MGSVRGQATVEAVASVLLLISVVVGLVQIILVGWTLMTATDAARAGSRARMIGADGARTARSALPRVLRRDARVTLLAADGVQVTVRVPTVVPLTLRLSGTVR